MYTTAEYTYSITFYLAALLYLFLFFKATMQWTVIMNPGSYKNTHPLIYMSILTLLCHSCFLPIQKNVAGAQVQRGYLFHKPTTSKICTHCYWLNVFYTDSKGCLNDLNPAMNWCISPSVYWRKTWVRRLKQCSIVFFPLRSFFVSILETVMWWFYQQYLSRCHPWHPWNNLNFF